jgi:two-component system chemotaxis response regulator CheB
VVSISNDESELGVEALQAGAVTVVQKPTALATDRLYELAGPLILAIKTAALARSMRPLEESASTRDAPEIRRASQCRLVVIGTSTGGPQALTRLLPRLPKDFPVPIAIALHIPAGYTEELAKRLDRSSAIDVVEASHDLVLRPGLAVLAQGGRHLKLTAALGRATAQISDEPRSEPHAPSVDVLFQSASQLGANVLGVVLTGMGSDGLRGARSIRDAGGRILTEAEGSCIVYGMPAAVKEAGLSEGEAVLDDMALMICRSL